MGNIQPVSRFHVDFLHTVTFKIHRSERTVLSYPDLVPKENLEKWLNYLKKEFPTVAFKSATLMKDRTMVRAGCLMTKSGVLEIMHVETC